MGVRQRAPRCGRRGANAGSLIVAVVLGALVGLVSTNTTRAQEIPEIPTAAGVEIPPKPTDEPQSAPAGDSKTDTPAKDKDETSKPAAGVDPAATDVFLQRTERGIGLARVDDLAPLAAELRLRGMPKAADEIKMTSTADDYRRLVRALLFASEYAAVREVLRAWQKQEPRSSEPAIYAGIVYQGEGESELALRELRAITATIPDNLKGIVGLQRSLLSMQLAGMAPGLGSNPWRAHLVGQNGEFEPGSAAKAELEKIPPGTTAALMELLDLLPRDGNLWAMLGEILNAQGDPRGALECFRRAELLMVTSRDLRQRRRQLEDYRRVEEQKSQAALDEAFGATNPGTPAPPAANAVEPEGREEGGWVNLGSRPRVLVVMVVGGILVGGLVLLQLREWIRKSVRGRKGP